jgi:PDZ domain-containing protein
MAVPELRMIDGTGPSQDEIVRPTPGGRRHTVRWVLWGVALVVVVGVFVASRINLDYYAIQPGTAQSVQPFITVPPGKGHPVAVPVLLTDVEEARVTALSYLFFKLQSDTALYSVPSVTGGVSPAELDAQGALQMSQAETAAKVASLRHLGYAVPGTPVGAVIAGTFPGTPAYGVLNVGDVVTAVDGKPTPSALALTTALTPYGSGQSVTFTVRRNGTAAPGPVTLTLRRTVVDVDGEKVVVSVGIEPQDQIDYTYPFPVSIDVVNIGGPSAGLAMTLGVIDTLSGGQLTGGHKVAATGTMDALGDVGDVGGVAQKTVAVENAGATIFLVPPQEYGAAKSKDRSGLKIYAVTTLDQALRVLAANGGRVPTGTLDAAASSAAG